MIGDGRVPRGEGNVILRNIPASENVRAYVGGIVRSEYGTELHQPYDYKFTMRQKS